MKNSRVKMALLAISMGISVSVSAVSYPGPEQCLVYENMCEAGNTYGCQLVARYCLF
ncbi:hypothetical protein [Thalassomonas sp. RHCl1]|uniref:hypothetical protein n=1 Tax=Thalassomonas sp. RHCl1 TaxID=2995320 RepID=UPI00248D211E|nr:hypothetical protein [Thalassomonas sp. RHCl1]